MLWKSDEKEALRELASQLEVPLTGDQIAVRMTERYGRPFTRNMISGEANRMGIRIRGKRKPPKTKPKPVKPEPKPEPKVIKVNPPVKTVPLWLLSMALTIPEASCTIIELKPGRCKFPLWPHALRPHVSYPYCGSKTRPKSPYCEAHRKVCYRNDPRSPFDTV